MLENQNEMVQGNITKHTMTNLPMRIDLVEAIGDMYERVSAMNQAFGNKAFDYEFEEDAEEDADFLAALFKQAKLVLEEATELKDAETESDKMDALCDFFVVYLGMLYLDPHNKTIIGDKTFSFEDYSGEYDLSDLDQRSFEDLLSLLKQLVHTESDKLTPFEIYAGPISEVCSELYRRFIIWSFDDHLYFVDCFNHVMDANMSKLVDPDVHGEEQALVKYKSLGVPVELEDSPVKNESGKFMQVIRVSETVTIEEKEYPKGKFLKGPAFFEPKFMMNEDEGIVPDLR